MTNNNPKLDIKNCKTLSKYLILLILTLTSAQYVHGQTNNILMFIAHEEVYYSEYIVMKEALEASGYSVDVVSSSDSVSTVYMAISQDTIEEAADALLGSDYNEFLSQYLDIFGSSWDPLLNSVPVAGINVNGRIQDIVDMSAYDALIVVGGTGALAYRVDGDYQSQGDLSALEVQNAAEKLNQLALEALSADKPVMAQCHGASIPIFWRIPGTIGTGAETLGFSLLKGSYATAFPDDQLPVYAPPLGVIPRGNDRVTIASPHSDFYDVYNATTDMGKSKIITTRDWYPQTITFAAKSLINIIETFPSQSNIGSTIATLIIHGGEVDCTPGSGTDIPCNHGDEIENIPADYVDIVNLLQADSAVDSFDFNITDIDLLNGPLPFDINDSGSILSYLSQFDSIVFFKHWESGITLELQQAIVTYTDNGGTLVGLHHAAYHNSNNATFNKNLLVQLFGVQSTLSTWAGVELENQEITTAQNGHFITSYGTESLVSNYGVPILNFESGANTSFSNHHGFPIFDEIYRNWQLVPGQEFGLEINQLTPLLKNGSTSTPDNSQQDYAGVVKRYDGSLDGSIGQVVFMMSGERQESININHPYGQLIRNSVAWINVYQIADENQAPSITSPNSVSVVENQTAVMTVTATDPDGDEITFSIADGNDGELFIMTTNGELSFISAPDYVTENQYSLNVIASDNGIPVLTDTQNITVNIFEGPIFSNGFEAN